MSRRRSARRNAGTRSASCVSVSFGTESRQVYSLSNIGTIHPFEAVNGIDIIRKNGIQRQIRTGLYNLCAMPAYDKKSMEELRFEDYISRRKYPSLHTNSLFGASTTNQNIFNPNITTTSSALGFSLFENKPVVSKPPSSLFQFGAPMTTTAPFIFPSTPSTPFGSFVFTTAPIGSQRPFIFGSRQTPTTNSAFDLVSSEMGNYTSDSDEEKTASTQRRTSMETKCTRTPSPEIVRICADCKKLPHMQCLHCSKQVCLDCAKEHVDLVAKQVDIAQHDLHDKTSILDRLAAAAKERVNLECDKIKQGLDAERDQAFVQIDQLLEQQKKQIQDKSNELNQLSLDKIPPYIQRITAEMENLNEVNDQLFCVTSILPKIQVQHNH